MDETPDCEQVGPLLPELATGAITGHERAQALRHVAGCPSCRGELAELSRVADNLLLLAPQREPPAGFESAVMRRLDLGMGMGMGRHLGLGRPRRPLRRSVLRLVAVAAAVVVAASAGAGLESWRNAPDRQLAEQYRQVIAQPGDQRLRSAAVTTDDGAVVGHIYLYPGSPSWVMVAITAAPAPGDYAMEVVTVDGLRYAAGICPVNGTRGTVGYPLPAPSADIATIELTRPGTRLTAHPG